jgi:2-polyprenyl-3-methyl-5-hydroxy-6-metoxy-1,4-benzoquinol methylase
MQKEQIISFFNSRYSLNEEQSAYLTIHAKRFELILKHVNQYSYQQVLDIGPSFLSILLQEKYHTNLSLLGFADLESTGGHLPNFEVLKQNNLIIQDLNFWQAMQNDSKKYDLIICAEVIEHLYSSPFILLQNFYSLLAKNGVLIIQTPNAVSLKKRLKLLFGKNPYDIPRENIKNPGHFREYTLKELVAIGNKTGFKVQDAFTDEYFENPSLTSKIYRSLKPIIPANLRSGITLILQKP